MKQLRNTLVLLSIMAAATVLCVENHFNSEGQTQFVRGFLIGFGGSEYTEAFEKCEIDEDKIGMSVEDIIGSLTDLTPDGRQVIKESAQELANSVRDLANSCEGTSETIDKLDKWVKEGRAGSIRRVVRNLAYSP